MPTENTTPRVQFIYGADGQAVFVVMPLIEYVRLLERANEALEEPAQQERPARRLPNIHPGEVLETEFLDPAGCSWNELSRKTDLPRYVIRELIFAQRPVTSGIATKLAGYFGTSAQFWIGLQADYDAKQSQHAQGDSDDLHFNSGQ